MSSYARLQAVAVSCFSSMTCYYSYLGITEVELALCTCWRIVFLFTGEALLSFDKRIQEIQERASVSFHLSLSLLPFKSLFLLEMCAEDTEGHMLILSK